MKNVIHVVLLIVRIIGILFNGVFTAFLAYNQIYGPSKATKLLESIGFYLNYHGVMIVGFAILIILVIITIIVHHYKI